MNLSKNEIKEKYQEIMKQEKELGVKINLDITDIYEGRQDVLWYGGIIGDIRYEDYIIEIEVVGEVVADLYIGGEEVESISTDWNRGVFYEKFSDYFNTDVELYESILYEDTNDESIEEFNGNPVMFVMNNNWIEANIYKDGSRVDTGFMGNIIDENDVLEAFEGIAEYIGMIKEYEK